MTDVRRPFQTYEPDPQAVTALAPRKIAVLGYGAQGRAQALNLRDSGATVKVGLREGSAHAQSVIDDGLTPISFEEAALWADTFLFLLPDEIHPLIYEKYLADALEPGDALVFAHGLTPYWKTITVPDFVDVIMVAPKGPGIQVRSYFEAGGGLTNVVDIAQDGSGHARELMIALAAGIGGKQARIVESSCAEEAITDLFGEQVVLCGGVLEMMKAGFEVLCESGVAPELAYNECIQEMKLIIDLIAEHGFGYTYDVISTTAEFGGYRTGRRLVTEATREEMRNVLREIEDGTFAREWVSDARAGSPKYHALKEEFKSSVEAIDEAGERARSLFKPRLNS